MASKVAGTEFAWMGSDTWLGSDLDSLIRWPMAAVGNSRS